jgi:riboflavin biosynthesis pyrimidine reductase
LLTDRFGGLTASETAIRQYFSSFPSGRVRASIVLSGAGGYVDANGESTLLSSPLDRAWLGVVRSSASAIVTTGATVRAERVRQTSVPLIIASKSGDIAGLRPDSNAELYVASDAETHESWPEHARWLGRFADVGAVIGYSASRWHRVQVEAGLTQLVAGYRARLIDRVFVTTPGGANTPTDFGQLTELCQFDDLRLMVTS